MTTVVRGRLRVEHEASFGRVEYVGDGIVAIGHSRMRFSESKIALVLPMSTTWILSELSWPPRARESD